MLDLAGRAVRKHTVGSWPDQLGQLPTSTHLTAPAAACRRGASIRNQVMLFDRQLRRTHRRVKLARPLPFLLLVSTRRHPGKRPRARASTYSNITQPRQAASFLRRCYTPQGCSSVSYTTVVRTEATPTEHELHLQPCQHAVPAS